MCDVIFLTSGRRGTSGAFVPRHDDMHISPLSDPTCEEWQGMKQECCFVDPAMGKDCFWGCHSGVIV